MITKELFEEVLGPDVFSNKRTPEVADKRNAAYLFMRNGRMTYREIADLTGRTHPTILSGVKRFKGLLESGDKRAMEIWGNLCNGIIPLLTQYGVVISNIYIKGEVITIPYNKNA